MNSFFKFASIIMYLTYIPISMAANDSADIAAIVKIEKDFAQMQISKDPKLIALVEQSMPDKLYWHHVDDGSVATKKELLDAIQSKDCVLTSTTFDPFVVRIFGSTAIVHCINKSTATFQGKDIIGTFESFDVFAKENGRWIWVAFDGGKVGGKLSDKVECNGAVCAPNQPGFTLRRTQ